MFSGSVPTGLWAGRPTRFLTLLWPAVAWTCAWGIVIPAGPFLEPVGYDMGPLVLVVRALQHTRGRVAVGQF